jgi:DNA-binding MarR family transcriptional regulator
MARAATQKAERPVESAAIDFAGLSDLAGFVVHLANLQLYRDYYERFAGNAAGLTLGAFSVMALIDANPGLRQGAAAEALLIKRSNMTKLINRLERQGLVRRRASGRDRRSVGLHLTPLGRRRLGLMLPAIAAHDAEATAPLDVRERRLLVGLLGKVVFAKRAP